jgi:hypothetical protein
MGPSPGALSLRPPKRDHVSMTSPLEVTLGVVTPPAAPPDCASARLESCVVVRLLRLRAEVKASFVVLR